MYNVLGFYHEPLLALIDYPVIHIYIYVHMYLLISLDAKYRYYMYKHNQNLHVKHFILLNGKNKQFCPTFSWKQDIPATLMYNTQFIDLNLNST